MASYRQIHTKIWKDPWFLDLEPDHKLLFIYLFSNEQANMMGLYQIPLKVISFETDIPLDAVQEALDQFAAAGKVYYEDNYAWIVNMFQYNANNPGSPKTQAHILNTLDEIPDIPLKARLLEHYADVIPDVYPSDTPSIPVPQEQQQEQQQEQRSDQEQEQEKEQEQATATEGNGLAAACLRALHRLGIKEPKASQLVENAKADGFLPNLAPYMRDWLDVYLLQDGVTNPQGLAITQVEQRVPPPARAGPTMKF